MLNEVSGEDVAQAIIDHHQGLMERNVRRMAAAADADSEGADDWREAIDWQKRNADFYAETVRHVFRMLELNGYGIARKRAAGS